MILRRGFILKLVLLFAVFSYLKPIPLQYQKNLGYDDHTQQLNATATATPPTVVHHHEDPTAAATAMHMETMSILPLLPWEQEAINNLRRGSTTCDHPKGTHKTCCPGSFSRGGRVTARFRNDCFHADFDQMHGSARQFVTQWPANTDTCDICRILEILRLRDEPLTVLGDSMTMQTFDGLHCELERRNYVVEMTSTVRPLWDEGWGNIKTNATLTVRSPLWENDEVVRIQMYFIYSVPFNVPEEADEINQAGGILWFNFGLHDGANQLDQLESDMTAFFATIKANSTFSLILFRETTAQHYDTPSGLWHVQPHRGLFCTPLEWTDEVGRRDQAVLNAALAVGYELVPPTAASFSEDGDKIVVLPFHNFTAELHAGHPNDHGDYNNMTRGECTHFCSTPLLWMPLWRTLRIAMDSALLTSGSKDPTYDILSNVTLVSSMNESKPTLSTVQEMLPPTKDTVHHERVSVLPLLPWEEEAIQNLRNGSAACNNPVGVQRSCCPGSFSRGGGVAHNRRNHCSHADYEQVDRVAQLFVSSWPTSSCDICRILDILRSRNEPLTIMGDSMTMQSFDGFVCEVKRRNYAVQVNETIRHLRPELQGRGNIKSRTTLVVSSPSWPPGAAAHIQLFFIYSLPFVMVEEAEEINHAGGILLFNFGLHDEGDLPFFQASMQSFFANVKENATFSQILFRETTAQHFDVPGGMDPPPDGKPRSTKCTAIMEWTKDVGMRDRAVVAAALEAGYEVVSPMEATFGDGNKLVILPYHNFTAQLHDSHPIFDSGDCTHYCSTPLLWVPLWRTLRIAMDAAFVFQLRQ